MFWKPKTTIEWWLVIGVVTVTLAWTILRWQWFSPSDIVRTFDHHEVGVFATGPAVDLLVMVPLWLIYGILRVQVRRRHPAVAQPSAAVDRPRR